MIDGQEGSELGLVGGQNDDVATFAQVLFLDELSRNAERVVVGAALVDERRSRRMDFRRRPRVAVGFDDDGLVLSALHSVRDGVVTGVLRERRGAALFGVDVDRDDFVVEREDRRFGGLVLAQLHVVREVDRHLATDEVGTVLRVGRQRVRRNVAVAVRIGGLTGLVGLDRVVHRLLVGAVLEQRTIDTGGRFAVATLATAGCTVVPCGVLDREGHSRGAGAGGRRDVRFGFRLLGCRRRRADGWLAAITVVLVVHADLNPGHTEVTRQAEGRPRDEGLADVLGQFVTFPGALGVGSVDALGFEVNTSLTLARTDVDVSVVRERDAVRQLNAIRGHAVGRRVV